MSQDKPNAGQASDAERRPNPTQSNRPQPGSLHRDPTRPVRRPDLSEEEFDEGPRPEPVDEIQRAIFEAAQADLKTDIEFDELGKPALDLDEGPRPEPVDEVQEALFSAIREGATEIDFDTLPEPTPARKVIKFEKAESESRSATAAVIPPPKTEPLPHPAPEPAEEAEPEPKPISTASEFWLALALFVAFRVFTLALLKPGGFIRDWSHFDIYFGVVSLTDYSLYPFLNFWLEWPPLVPWLAVGAYKLSLLLPPWPDDPRLWFILILGAVFLLFEVGNFVLIYRLARRLFHTPETLSRVLWIYIALFPPVYAMLGFFDGIALFFILLALELLLDDRRFPSAIAVGVGFMVKVVPALMLPVAARHLWHKYRANNREAGIEMGLYGVAFGLAVLVLLIPFIILPALNDSPQWWITTFRSMAGRSSWETIWAVAEGYYGFGAVEGNRWDAAETNFATHRSWHSAIWWLITLAWIALYGFIFTRQANYNRPRKVIAFAGLTVALFMLSSKGYSPQFLVYVLPFILLLLPAGRGVVYMLALAGLNVLEQPVYFVLLPGAAWLLVFIVVVRFLIMLLLAVEFALVLWPAAERLVALEPLVRRVPLALTIFAAASLIILTPLTIRAYTLSRIENSSVGTLAGFLTSQLPDDQSAEAKPRLLLSDQATYRQIYPHLSHLYDLQLTDGLSRNFPNAAAIPTLLEGARQVWILPTGPQARALVNIVEDAGSELAAYDFVGLGTVSLYTLRPNPAPIIPPARFVGGIELLSHHIETDHNGVDVTLYWRARNPQNQNLTAFTQLLNAEGQRVAGHDNIPANGQAPVLGWTVNAVVADPHRIELPPNLPAGEYTLIVGLYNDFNERVLSIDPAGVDHPNRAVPLATVQLQ
jgi:hypothetical protein